jgi:hypothetical protein
MSAQLRRTRAMLPEWVSLPPMPRVTKGTPFWTRFWARVRLLSVVVLTDWPEVLPPGRRVTPLVSNAPRARPWLVTSMARRQAAFQAWALASGRVPRNVSSKAWVIRCRLA